MTEQFGATGDDTLEFISVDGKNVFRLTSDKMTDILNPYLVAFTANESNIYLLVIGHTPQNKMFTLRTPDGKTSTQRAYATHDYIARFGRDGSYSGSVPIDLPFIPRQFGAFANGDFFFAGSTNDTDEPRAALVKSSGQFNRFLELPGDIHARGQSSESNDDGLSLPIHADRYQDTLGYAVALSMVVPDGRNMLLVRPGQKSPLFSVSPGGDVQPVTIEIPRPGVGASGSKGPPDVPVGALAWELFDVKAAQDQWIATYERPTTDPQRQGLEFATFGVNKTTGKLVTQYVIPQNLAGGLACGDGQTFRLLSWGDGKLHVITVSKVQ